MGGYILCSLPLALFVEGTIALSASVNLLDSNVNGTRQPSAFFDNLGNINETTGQPATFLGNFTTHQHQVFVGWKTFKKDILRIRRKKVPMQICKYLSRQICPPKKLKKAQRSEKICRLNLSNLIEKTLV